MKIRRIFVEIITSQFHKEIPQKMFQGISHRVSQRFSRELPQGISQGILHVISQIIFLSIYQVIYHDIH